MERAASVDAGVRYYLYGRPESLNGCMVIKEMGRFLWNSLQSHCKISEVPNDVLNDRISFGRRRNNLRGTLYD